MEKALRTLSTYVSFPRTFARHFLPPTSGTSCILGFNLYTCTLKIFAYLHIVAPYPSTVLQCNPTEPAQFINQANLLYRTAQNAALHCLASPLLLLLLLLLFIRRFSSPALMAHSKGPCWSGGEKVGKTPGVREMIRYRMHRYISR